MGKVVKETVVTIDDAQLVKIDKKIKSVQDLIRPIESQAEYEAVAEKLKVLKEYKKAIDEFFAEMLAAAKATVKAIEARKKKHKDPAEEADEKLRELAGQWIAKQEEIRAREQAKLDAAREKKMAKLEAKNEEREAKGLAPVDTFVPVAQAEAVEKSGISYREVWDFEIVDEGAIPDSYFMVNTALIAAEVRAGKGQTNIPGVRVFSTKVPVVR